VFPGGENGRLGRWKCKSGLTVSRNRGLNLDA
jgi:hypothetical protein